MVQGIVEYNRSLFFNVATMMMAVIRNIVEISINREDNNVFFTISNMPIQNTRSRSIIHEGDPASLVLKNNSFIMNKMKTANIVIHGACCMIRYKNGEII